MMENNRLKNCFVDGKPVMEWLREEEQKQLGAQANEVYKLEVRNPAVIGQRIERALPKIARAHMPTAHGAAGRTVFYNNHLIRRMKGTMSKPYETMIENCLDVIFARAPLEPITNNKLAEALGKQAADVSSAMGRFLIRVKDVIALEGKRPPRVYRVLKGLTVEEAYETYQNACAKAAADHIAARKGQGVSMPKESAKPTLGGIPQEIKVTVQVSGCINFLFGFKKE